MMSDARGPAHDFVERLERLCGRRFWRVWRGAGSHLFFDAGQPRISVAERTNTRFEVGGHRVKRRPVYVKGSHGLHVEMAAWTVGYEGEQVAHSESPDKTFRELTRWFCGQSLVSLTCRGPTALDLQFDLGALLAVRRYEDFEDDEPLVTMWDDAGYLTLRADGTVEHARSDTNS